MIFCPLTPLKNSLASDWELSDLLVVLTSFEVSLASLAEITTNSACSSNVAFYCSEFSSESSPSTAIEAAALIASSSWLSSFSAGASSSYFFLAGFGAGFSFFFSFLTSFLGLFFSRIFSYSSSESSATPPTSSAEACFWTVFFGSLTATFFLAVLGFSAGFLVSLTADLVPVISSIISCSRGSTSFFAGAALVYFLTVYGFCAAAFLVSFFLTVFALSLAF